MRSEHRLAAAVLLALASWPAAAHVPQGAAASGFVAGLLHPIAGLDHLLAMIGVGLWGAILRRPLIWTLPIVFPLLMLLGAALGILGLPIPAVESGIAASVIGLGAVVVAAWRAPAALALLLVAAFGVLHGHAHGTELPDSASPASYAAGFILCTGLLHATGIVLGQLWEWERGRIVLRAAGALMAVAGTWLLVR